MEYRRYGDKRNKLSLHRTVVNQMFDARNIPTNETNYGKQWKETLVKRNLNILSR